MSGHWVSSDNNYLFSWAKGADEAIVATSAEDQEERLRAKILPKFKGEARCEPPSLIGYPRLPYFAVDVDANEKSKKALKRWVGSNLKDWPVCHKSRQPLELRFEGRSTLDEYGGEYMRPHFACPDCDAGR